MRASKVKDLQAQHLEKPLKKIMTCQKYVPFSGIKSVKVAIGTPFEIRIPTKQMNNLFAQIQSLKERCQILQKKMPQEQVKQIISSVKNIQIDLNQATCDTNFHEEKKINTDFKEEQESNERYKKLLYNFKEAQSSIEELEKENNELEQKILKNKQRTERAFNECTNIQQKVRKVLKQQ